MLTRAVKNVVSILILLILISGCKVSPHYFKPEYVKKFPAATGFVNDFENDFTSQQIAVLDSVIRDFKKKTTNQIAVVTVNSIAPYDSIREFASDLSNYWGIGDKKKNNGLIIVFSKSLREVWIGTGLGTEKILTDGICNQVVDEYMLPHFKNQEYFEGVYAGLEECIQRWK